jgi:hypothetical protein
MSWQKEAVEAMCRIEYGSAWQTITEAGKQPRRAHEAEKLKAALPLIEVTPGMANAGKDQLGRHFPKWHDAIKAFEAMLTTCAKEKTP